MREDGWMPIETAPKDGTWILLSGGTLRYGWDHDDAPDCVVGQWTQHLNGRNDSEYGRWQMAWFDGGYYGEYEKPTRWQPLPAPPKDTP